MQKVLKFGGTSVGSIESISSVIRILKNNHSANQEIAVVFSAMGGVTNLLIEAGNLAAKNKTTETNNLITDIENRHFEVIKKYIPVKNQSGVIAQIRAIINELKDVIKGIQLLKEISPKSAAIVQSFGERLSVPMLYYIFKQEGLPVEMVDSREIVKTKKEGNKDIVDFPQTDKNILDLASSLKGKIPVITGFIASDAQGEITTLGRGGSDYTASIFGAALNVDEIEIWTDVDGIMTSDPRMVKNAFSIPEISYAEAMELTHFGAKVIYPPSLIPAFLKNIPIRVLNTFNTEFPGTIVKPEVENSHDLITGISSIKEIALVNVEGSGMIGVAGISSRIFTVLSKESVSVSLISQASSEHSICFAVEPSAVKIVDKVLRAEFERELAKGQIEDIYFQEDQSIIAIVGEGMKQHTGIAGKLFSGLGKNGINVTAIAQGSSELNISVVINRNDLAKALNVIHESFFFGQIKTLNLFIVGLGLIGKTLIEQFKQQENFLAKYRNVRIKIIGVANSRKMLIDEQGIELDDVFKRLDESKTNSDLAIFSQNIIDFNLANSVFVDCTADKNIVEHYLGLFQASVSVVTPNKVANSGPYADYVQLHQTALSKGVKFLYETNVGAGLPVINTLQGLIASGDRFEKIEGVLSGTLSYIFNNFGNGTSFAEIVRMAKAKGFTEPDPREDLGGMDVARKILILCREIGMKLEPSDVKIERIIPENCQNAQTVDDFFEELEKSNEYFEELAVKAKSEKKRWRYIATYENGGVTIGLRMVGEDHPFFMMEGADNIIAFTTKRYSERPLVIKGPGAGAEVTASGVFADIVSLGSFLG
jgi:aspartokinase/homoserine dehydrogenase 1